MKTVHFLIAIGALSTLLLTLKLFHSFFKIEQILPDAVETITKGNILQTLPKIEANPLRFEHVPASTPCNGKVIGIETILHNKESWGRKRSFVDYVNLIQNFTFPSECLHLNLLVSSEEEYGVIKSYISSSQLMFGKITMILDTGKKGETLSREGRHNNDKQRERRRKLAKLRNFLLYSTLAPEVYGVLWIDADVTEIPPHLLADVVESEKDIVASQTDIRNWGTYDQNTWVGKRSKPTEAEFLKIRNGTMNYTPRGGKWLSTFPHKKGERFVEVAAVGGSFLFVRADIHREGINFPPVYMILLTFSSTSWVCKTGT
jgi:hypothetical protein